MPHCASLSVTLKGIVTGNAPQIDLFATWTTDFRVRLNRQTNALEFEVQPDEHGKIHIRNLFRRSGTNERQYQRLLNSFLSLTAESSAEQWEKIAAELGPLIARHPLHHVGVGNEIKEPISLWLTAQKDLAALWDDLQHLSRASDIVPIEAERREEAIRNVLIMGITPAPDGSIPPEHEHLIEAYMPPATSAQQQLVSRIGDRLNRWFLHGHPAIKPLLNPFTLRAEIVVEQGIQALFLMSVALSREDASSFPTRCARANCTNTFFTSGKKKYCSEACQHAAKAARQRQRMKAKGQS